MTTGSDVKEPTRKREILQLAREYLFPNRIDSLEMLGVDLVIGHREGYRFRDLDGRELMDLHLNGGTYNLGHRHPELLDALLTSLRHSDVGNHHFANPERALLAEQLALSTGLRYSVFTPGGAEANDVAIRSARRYTGRRRIVSLEQGYHGRSGLSGAAGNPDNARFFNSDYPAEFTTVPFNDLAAMESTLRRGDVAAVIMETIPATAGFPIPDDNYLPGVRALCDQHGALYIADEVQTGLGRTGKVWAVACWGVQPDILITGKGLSGGLYPVSAAVLSAEVGGWLAEDGWGYVSTFGGAEPGCAVGRVALRLSSVPATLAGVKATADYLRAGLEDIRGRRPFLTGINQKGLVIGLRFDDPNGGMRMSAALFQKGLWAMFASFDRAVLQFKPGLLVDRAFCDEALSRLDDTLAEVAAGRRHG
jgi:acetylornithine/succinyldiaminopimelate/putrescine aminotransferase